MYGMPGAQFWWFCGITLWAVFHRILAARRLACDQDLHVASSVDRISSVLLLDHLLVSMWQAKPATALVREQTKLLTTTIATWANFFTQMFHKMFHHLPQLLLFGYFTLQLTIPKSEGTPQHWKQLLKKKSSPLALETFSTLTSPQNHSKTECNILDTIDRCTYYDDSAMAFWRFNNWPWKQRKRHVLTNKF